MRDEAFPRENERRGADSAATRRGEGPIQHIGDPRGRIAIWCDEADAFEIAARFPYPDTFSREIHDAIDRAYPIVEDEEGLGLGVRIGVGHDGPTMRVVDLREEAS